MPTKHQRISVTNDPELSDALARVEGHFTGVRKSTIVHDLAVKGAEALGREQEARDAAVERLVAFSTQPGDVLDLDVLENVDALAWGESPE